MTSGDPLQVRLLGQGELELYHQINAASFGLILDPAQLESKRPLVEFDRWYLAEFDGEVCGGTGSFHTELTVPGGSSIPAAAANDAGVLPSHRRLGVFSALMERQLRDLRDSGEVVALLHASEGSIYSRYGYGVATSVRQVSVQARRVQFRSDCPDPSGTTRIVDRATAIEPCAAVHARACSQRVGGVARTADWWELVLGDAESFMGGGQGRLVVLHLDEAGTADGYAIYQIAEDWSTGQAEHVLAIWELLGETISVELALWRMLLSHDLVSRVQGFIATDHLLWNVVVDPRQIHVDYEQDRLWLRLLDVEAALSARSYATSDMLNGVDSCKLVFGLRDALLSEMAGSYTLDVQHGVGTCTRSDAE
ncbi:MAG: GNAT family N-acetyltransferase, partial [Microthrixaceae bacterium]